MHFCYHFQRDDVTVPELQAIFPSANTIFNLNDTAEPKQMSKSNFTPQQVFFQR